MNKSSKRLDHNSILFLGALLVFSVVCLLRFFDYSKIDHAVAFAFMQQYRVSQLAYMVYVAVLICFFALILIRYRGENKKNAIYLIVLVSEFMLSMFLTENYFGAPDGYAVIGLIICLGLMLIDRGEFLIIPISSALVVLCPSSVLSYMFIVLVLLMSKYEATENSRYLIYFIITVVCEIIGLAYSIYAGYFSFDQQHTITLKMFIATLIMMIPYMALAIYFFKNYLSRKKSFSRILYLLGGIIGFLTYAIAGDYSRCVSFTFVYYGLVVLLLTSLGYDDAEASLEDCKKRVLKITSIGILVLIYPLLFITLWMYGPVELFVETTIGV